MDSVVQAHGANVGAMCSKCGKKFDRQLLDEHIDQQKILRCEETISDSGTKEIENEAEE
jgi:NAD-dependent SIR2 family protein deacetylase